MRLFDSEVAADELEDPSSVTAAGSHHQSDRSLLVDVNGDIGALDPRVGAQVSQSYIRVSAREKALYFTCL